MRKAEIKNTFVIAVTICAICSVLVSTAAVYLRPTQARNQELDRKKNILEAAGLLQEGMDIEQVFAENIQGRLVDLETGQYVTEDIPNDYDSRKEARIADLSVTVPPAVDVAGIKQHAKRMPVYFVKGDAGISKLVLPVFGKGLWSTMYGFISVSPDTKTILGLTFYEHGETPGLGGEIDNPSWKSTWRGKVVYDESWNPVLQVEKGRVDPTRPGAQHRIDGLSGATITARGVGNLVRFWFSKNGYGVFLENFRTESLAHG